MNTTQKETIRKMRYMKLGYSHIAKELGLSVNTVKSYCFRNGLNTEALKDNIKLCKNCGQLITKSSKTRPRKFCCDKCKQAWWNKHRYERENENITVYSCVICGKEFSDYGNTHRKYCSQACYQKRGTTDGE